MWLKTGIKVTQNNEGPKTHHQNQFSLHFQLSSLFYG